MLMLNCSPQEAVKGTANLLYVTIALHIYTYIYIKIYQSFQVIARIKLVSFTILTALILYIILYNNLIGIPEATLFR